MLRIGSILHLILQLFLFALLGRLILDYVRMFKPAWRPSGVVLILVEAIYTITDRPMNFVRRFVPPLRLGGVSLDLSFIVLFFAIQMLMPLVLLI
ncbi:MAG: YggT family protein [Actinobacteria bacterium]|jgi:YggT family protein|nr:YggT family protein [Actinomycetota bacterium]NDA95034.1 YggT family protein [Actinomycetota bacterium]NDH80755.1 YggT family protein [Actinomycetota bacterium]NDH98845.1 YggT family protein [Actinomycetota bacterium]NDI08049.1 YggT family protein [Actinomycetota bacterium]